MAGTDEGRWAEHAAAEGAAVSADPGESGEGVGGADDPTSSPPGSGERTFDSPDSDPAPGETAPSNHLTGGGDPAEGKR